MIVERTKTVEEGGLIHYDKELHGLWQSKSNAMHVFAEKVTYWGRFVDSCPMHRYDDLNKE